MDRSLISTLNAAAALLLALTFSSVATAAQPAISRAPNGRAVYHVPACPGPAAAGTARCHAHVVTDRAGSFMVTARPEAPGGGSGKGGHGGGGGGTPTPPSGLYPSALQDAYKVPVSGISPGSGLTIAIVDAFGYANAEKDLNVYRKQFGLGECTTSNGCFSKVDQRGATGSYPRDDTGWSQETALDLDMASAICPNCKILLVEADSNSYANLGAAVNTAARLGAVAISNSYGGGESASIDESPYNHAGIAITASSGDSGYGVSFPASSPHVTAVGGTRLVTANNARGWAETAWSGAGSGCSSVYPKPSWQTDSGCAKRSVADVSAVADPATGVAVYAPVNRKGSGWLVFGGTSASAPIIAAMYGRNGGGVTYGEDPYNNTAALFDVTSGSNGSCGGSYLCTAVQGYDGPTGLGTPNGDSAF